MNVTLAGFRHLDDRPPSEGELRRLVEYLEGLRGPIAAALARATPPVHHFRVTAERDERTTYAPAVAGRSWLLNVSPGAVGDRPVTILYQLQGDVRGWTPPANAPAVKPGYSFFDRTLYDQDEPRPQLLILAPEFGGAPTTSDLFASVADYARPTFFRTAEMWAYDLYQASVILTADTSNALPPGITVPIGTQISTPIRRVRAHVHSVPRVDLLANGTLVEVARLYLLRDPEAAGGAADDILLVQQKLYWSLQSVVVTLTEDVGTFDPFNPLIEVTDGQEVLFWTA